MIETERCIVIDIDGTLCPVKGPDERYDELQPIAAVLDRLRAYKAEGFHIILFTARSMRTHGGNVGRINATTAKRAMAWLDRHDVPYDEIHFGKPWQGKGGFYVDDKAIRPDEFVSLSYEAICALVGEDPSGT
jgi:capsule biosynthesis phosphatase